MSTIAKFNPTPATSKSVEMISGSSLQPLKPNQIARNEQQVHNSSLVHEFLNFELYGFEFGPYNGALGALDGTFFTASTN